MASRWNRFFTSDAKPSKRPGKATRRALRFESLETRQMLHGTGLDTTYLSPLLEGPMQPTAYVAPASPSAEKAGAAASSFGTSAVLSGSIVTTSPPLVNPGTDPRTVDQQMGLPFLDSNPGAPATLYLDFDGNFEPDWWQYDGGQQKHFRNFSTPVFDTDGNAASFSSSEQSLIKEIWSRVSEDYAPFNVNVSTDYYGSFNNNQAVHVVIGGNNTDWLHQDASGISSIGSFTDDAPNEVFVFNLMTWATAGVKNGDGVVINGPAAIATTASHEAGHSFGLRHHALYKVDGTKITDYDPGSSGWTPIMGDNLASDRTTWDAGPTDINTWQDDMAILGGTKNGFGAKADDHGNTPATADPLTSNALVTLLTGKGIVNTMYDVDAFKFTTGGGTLQVTVNAAKYGPNLIPVAELWTSSGFITRANAGSMTQSIINATVPAGTYYVMVKGFGDYGDVGQYTVSVSFSLTKTQGSLLASSTTTTTTTTTPTSTQPLYTTSTAGATYGSSGSGQAATLVDTGAPAGLFVPMADNQAKPNPTHVHDVVFQLDEAESDPALLSPVDFPRLRSPRRLS